MTDNRVAISERFARILSSRFYIQTNHDLTRAILVAGTARSGTTWLAQMLAKLLHYRLIFEPYSNDRVTEYGFNFRQYLRPDDPEPDFRSFTQRLFTGYVRNVKIDLYNSSFFPRGRIVKDIRASLFLKWISKNFSDVPIVYILRHPCAVAHSWSRLGWGERDIASLLHQEPLFKDHLESYMITLREVKTNLARSAFVWCLDQIVPLRTMDFDDWLVSTYEDLWLNPKLEVKRMMKYFRIPCDESQIENQARIPAATVRRDSAILTSRNPIDAWKTELSDHQIEEIMRVVRRFSLDLIYDTDPLPHKENLNRFLKHHPRI